MDIRSEIRNICEEFMSDDQFIVDIVMKGSNQNNKIIILIDGDNGITIEECARISRKLGHRIEEEDLIKGSFVLELSSPGVDFPLSNIRQFQKNIGRNLKVEMNSGDSVTGKLLKVSPEEIEVEKVIQKKKNKHNAEEENKSVIKFNNIQKATVQISFK